MKETIILSTSTSFLALEKLFFQETSTLIENNPKHNDKTKSNSSKELSEATCEVR